MNVERSIIAITGAGGGLGQAMARRLARAGAEEAKARALARIVAAYATQLMGLMN